MRFRFSSVRSPSPFWWSIRENPRHGDEPGADVALYLSRHGAKVVVEQVQSHGEPIAKVILAYAERHDTDLIVVGAYSHARTTEMIFGGVTRSCCETPTFRS